MGADAKCHRATTWYALPLAVSVTLFGVFAAIRYVQGPISPVLSLGTACALVAAAAAAFAYRWPARSPWQWGLLLSSAFSFFLLFAFAMFQSVGQPEWWPLGDALTVAAASCVGAYAARAFRSR